MNHIPKGNYRQAFYRVSVKAIIRGANNEVLVVKEKGSGWSLPGGGIDHGESAEVAFARELEEEVGITAPFRAQCIGINQRYVKSKQAWLLWVVYELQFDTPPAYSIGPDADDVRYIDPITFRSSDVISEQLVYKWCVDKTYPVKTW